MKTFVIVLLVVAVCVTAAALVQQRIHKELLRFQSDFEHLRGVLAAGDKEGAKTLCESIVHAWDDKREQWEVFIDHTTLDEVEATIYLIKGHIESDAPEVYWNGELSQIYAQLVQLDMQTRLTWGHLF